MPLRMGIAFAVVRHSTVQIQCRCTVTRLVALTPVVSPQPVVWVVGSVLVQNVPTKLPSMSKLVRAMGNVTPTRSI